MDKLFSEIFDLQGERITLRRLTQNDADSTIPTDKWLKLLKQ